uniref:CobQ/CobB/MinD/ParA nucleotide binding domain-containing protein n=1 Tax=Vibrio splendidus TaxID=29497 RepID=A0A0H3ZP58_VIBSP|nr:hypothetical protein [Vibrio splendidus]
MSILVIANQKGGTGKSSLSLNMIPHFKPDLIIDADIHKGISNLLSLGSNQIEVRTPPSKDKVLEWCKEDRRILIVCGGFDSDITRYCISQADIILTPTTDDPTDQFALVEFNKTMTAIGKMVDEDLLVNVVLNRVHHSRKSFPEISELIEGLEHLNLLDTKIPTSSLIPKFAFKGEAVINNKLTATFGNLHSELNTIQVLKGVCNG